MEAPMKLMCVVMFLMILSIAGINGVHGSGQQYGPCGKHNIEKEAEKLEPCTRAAQNRYVPVPKRCCDVIEKKLQKPGCLCAIMFTNTARNTGIKPEITVTIPKRCNIASRPVGHKCGAFPLL
ncbi:hypothetical protein COLO4_15112 [Corchorus olitorius]|uniref:Bifunctional inhibitor/plant lipid transfer protein/seed storage helical domain-containing protein n=1 Tax=Corchorus olitorius TaxID=93759 RepID=A0A1R3JPN5_9ROSI|nr:hypothetical protein COLO4_15112 [Corchorus olitorius]